MMFFSERTMPPWLSMTVGRFLRKCFYQYSERTTWEVLREITSNEKLIAVLCTQCGNYGLPPKKSSFAIHALIVEHYLEGGNYPVGGASSIHKTVTQVIEENGGMYWSRLELKILFSIKIVQLVWNWKMATAFMQKRLSVMQVCIILLIN